jgi:hypothetical protein
MIYLVMLSCFGGSMPVFATPEKADAVAYVKLWNSVPVDNDEGCKVYVK